MKRFNLILILIYFTEFTFTLTFRTSNTHPSLAPSLRLVGPLRVKCIVPVMMVNCTAASRRSQHGRIDSNWKNKGLLSPPKCVSPLKRRSPVDCLSESFRHRILKLYTIKNIFCNYFRFLSWSYNWDYPMYCSCYKLRIITYSFSN